MPPPTPASPASPPSPSGTPGPPAGATRQEVLRDFRRRQILEAAWRVFGEAGYGDASVDRIAEAAGVARSTVYVYFDGKEAILESCIGLGREELGGRIRAAVAQGGGAEARLAAFLAAILGYVGENRGFFRAVMSVLGFDAFFGVAGAPSSAALTTLREESRSAIAGILEEGVRSGELPKLDLAEAGDLLATLLYGALMRRADAEPAAPAAGAGRRADAPGDAASADEEARRLAHLFLHGVAGSGAGAGG